MRLFVGLDVSLAKIAISAIIEHGRIVRTAQVASEPEALLRWIDEQDGSIAAIGLEAGPLSQWLHRRLTEAGQPVVLMETLAGEGRPEGHADQDGSARRRRHRLFASPWLVPASLLQICLGPRSSRPAWRS